MADTQPYKFRVEIHRFGPGLSGADPTDITRYVKKINISQSVSGPWESLSLEMALPRPLQFTYRKEGNLIPHVGQWVVVYDDAYGASPGAAKDFHNTARALFVGYVMTARGGISANNEGLINSGQVSVQAVGWLDLLGLVRVQKAPVSRSRGTLLSFNERLLKTRSQGTVLIPSAWTEMFQAMSGTAMGAERDADGKVQRRDVGKSLQALVKVVGRVMLPPSIGGGRTSEKRTIADPTQDKETREALLKFGAASIDVTVNTLTSIGDRVVVVHDKDTRDAYAPNLDVDPVPGWTVRGIQSVQQKRGTAQQFITSTFGGDPNLVELFPVLTDPGTAHIKKSRGKLGGFSDNDARQAGQTGFEDEDDARVTQEENRKRAAVRKQAADNATAKAKERGPTLANPTSKAIGANLALVYRMRPWRSDDLERYNARNDTLGYADVKTDTSIFKGKTWRQNVGSIRSYESDQVIAVDYEWSDANRINCTTVGLPTQPGSDIAWLERSGLPLLAPSHPQTGGVIEQHGLRVYEPDWPFFPTFTGKDVTGSDLMTSLYTVALQGAMFMGAGHKFAAGTVSMQFDRTLRPGMFVDLALTLKDGDVTLQAYVESVTHTIEAEERGAILARTSITYSRGLFDEKSGYREQTHYPVINSGAL